MSAPGSPIDGLPAERRLLLVKLADLGDAVLLSAAVDAATRALPGWRLDLLLGSAAAPVFAFDERVRRVWGFDRRLIEGKRVVSPASLLAWGKLLWALRRERYDAVIVAHHLTTPLGALKLASVALASGAPVRAGLENGRGWFLNVREPDGGFGAVCEGAYWVRLVGAVTAQDRALGGRHVQGRLGIRVGQAARDRAAALLPVDAPRPVVALHHGLGGWMPSRAWKAEGYARVAELLWERVGGTLLLIGGPEERAAALEAARFASAPVRVLAGETDVQGLAALLDRCDLYVGPDSGPMHVAEAVGAPIVSLWGPTNERAWGPCEELGAAPAECLRAPDRPAPWVYVGHRMGDPRRPPDLGSLDPERVAEAVVRGLRTED